MKIGIMSFILLLIMTFSACAAQMSEETPDLSAEESKGESAPAINLNGINQDLDDAPDLENGDLSGKTYGVSIMHKSNAFASIELDAIKEIIEADGDILISADSATDNAHQIEQIKEMADGGIDVLIVEPIDAGGIEPALIECKSADVPVVVINSPVADNETAACTIVYDYKDGGIQAGRALCEAMGGEGVIGVVGCAAERNFYDITDGLKSVIENEYPDISIVEAAYEENAPDNAESAVDTLLKFNPNLKGILAAGDCAAQEVIGALNEINKTGEIFAATVDGYSEQSDTINTESIIYSAVRQPDLIGAEAVEAAKLITSGETPEKEIIIPFINIAE